MGKETRRYNRKPKKKETDYMKMLHSGLVDLLPDAIKILKDSLQNEGIPMQQRANSAKYIIDSLLSLNIFERSLSKKAEQDGDSDMQKLIMSALEKDCKIVKTVKEFEALPEIPTEIEEKL